MNKDKKELEKVISEFNYKVTITKKELELAFSSKLQRIRKMRRLTQRQLAERCNISIKTVQAYEQGTRKLEKANKNTILKICEVLNCKEKDILDNESENAFNEMFEDSNKRYNKLFNENLF